MSDPATAQAYRRLESLIVTLQLPPESSTTEKELVAAAGLGRTPVREAILRLAWEGLLEVRPRAGLRVAPLRAADWLQVVDARRGPEIELARDAAARRNTEQASVLALAGQAMRQAVAQADVEGFLRADKALDEAVAQAAGNLYAARAAAPLQAHSRRFWFRFKAADGLQAAAARHAALVEAITAGSEQQAAIAIGELMNLLRRHAREAADRYGTAPTEHSEGRGPRTTPSS